MADSHSPRRRRRRWRGSRIDGEDEEDKGEGCSYIQAVLYTQSSSRKIGSINNPSGLQQRREDPSSSSSTARRSSSTLNSICTCKSSSSSPRRRRKPSPSSILSTAILALAPHASASPVDAHWKGKGRAAVEALVEEDEDGVSENAVYGMNVLSSPSSLSSLQRSGSARHPGHPNGRVGGVALPAIIDGAGQAGRQHAFNKRQTHRSNTPEGVPSHYEYIDGQWVPTSDWSLNGLNGARHSSANVAPPDDGNEDDEQDMAGHGPSTRQNNADASIATATTTPRIGDDSIDDDIDDPLLSTTLGWAKSTNAVLGVDIETGLSDDDSTILNSATATLMSGAIVTRSNMATFTPLSSSSSSSSSSSTSPTPSRTASSSTSTSTSTSTSRSSGATAYDFSRDVPNGWISDGRTAAYAVPVIIGLSIFLACIIFGLILALLRMNKSRKKRRKAILNGKLKLSEEGKIPTRPNSPALSSSSSSSSTNITTNITGRSIEGRDNNYNHNSAFSSSLRRRRVGDVGGESNNDDNDNSNDYHEENEKNNKRRIIGRKWTPNLSNNTGLLLRKRRKKLAQLFKRDEQPQEIVVINEEEEEQDAAAVQQDSEVGARLNNNSRRRRSPSGSSTVSSIRSSRRRGEDRDDNHALSRSVTNASSSSSSGQNVQNVQETPEDTEEQRDTAYIRPPPLALNTYVATHSSNALLGEGGHQAPSSPLTNTSTRYSASTESQDQSPQHHQQQQHAIRQDVRNDSIDHGDHHAVPIPSIGPPAYMQPSTPAYSRNNGDASSSSLLAIPASGYMSNVSTPGLSSGIMDEKRALLGGFSYVSASSSHQQQDGSIIPGSSNDAFRDQRRYEHLYTSREGDENEQTTGAPSISTVIPSSSSSSDEAVARRAQLEAIEEHRRELQASLIGHVAISDKEVLGRLRMAASAPSPAIPAHNEGTNESSTSSISHSGSHTQEASAPSLDETEEEVFIRESGLLQGENTITTARNNMNPLLPEPPRPFQNALHQLPQIDEKTRLRQIEESQALSPISPILLNGFHDSSSAPSAPPSSSLVVEASAPSAPVFLDEDEDEIEYVQQGQEGSIGMQPSAPPMVDVNEEASAPTYVIEDEEEATISSDPETRPYHEGVV